MATKTTKAPIKAPIKAGAAPAPAAAAAPKVEKAALTKVEPIDRNVIPKGFAFSPSTLSGEEIVSKRCVFASSNTGITIDKDTPLEECIPMLNYFEGVKEHVGFFIGDVLVFMEDKFKERASWAMLKCGKAIATVRNYEWIARSFPLNMRGEGLTFSHYREAAPALKNADQSQVVALLKEARGTKTKAPMTTKELARVVKERFPKPPPKPKKAPKGGTKKKPAKKPAKQVTYYAMGPEEAAAADDLFEKIDAVNKIVRTKVNGKLWKDLYISLAPEERRGLVNALADIAELHKLVSFKLGYG